MKGYPTVTQIKRDYKKVMSILEKAKTLQDLKNLCEKHFGDVYFATRGYDVVFLNDIDFVDKTKMSYIRFDSYGCLDFITFHFDKKGEVSRIDFDIWSEKLDGQFVEEVRIDDVTPENLKKWISACEKPDYDEERWESER